MGHVPDQFEYKVQHYPLSIVPWDQVLIDQWGTEARQQYEEERRKLQQRRVRIFFSLLKHIDENHMTSDSVLDSGQTVGEFCMYHAKNVHHRRVRKTK